jgi:hypothetical protein
MHLGNITAAGPESVDHLTSTTRNMSIAPTLAQASSGVGPSIGGYGEEHRGLRTLRPGPGPAQPLQQSQPGTVPKDPFLAPVDCSSCLAAKKDNYCDRKVQCSGCIKRNVRCVYEEPDCDYCRDHQKKCNGKRPCAICARKGANCHYSEIPKGIEEPAGKTRGTIRSSGPAQPLQHSQSGIGGYGEQHQRTHDPVPAQPLQQSQSGTVREEAEFLAQQDCISCLKVKRDNYCDRKKRCSACIKRNVQCLYPPAGKAGGKNRSSDVDPSQKGKYKTCDYCRAHNRSCSGKWPCSICAKNDYKGREPKGADCHFSDIEFKTCNYCRAHQRKCNGKKPCSICQKNDDLGANCNYNERYREKPTTSGREIDFDVIVPNVRIRREDHSEDLVYVHPPGHIRRPEGVAENMIIGWDRRGSWVIRPANGAGLLPGELGINDAGDRAIRVDEGEPAGEMGGMRDMRAAATASRPPAQPQGFGGPGPSAPAHSVQGHNLAGSRHQRTSTESPPAEDLAKRRRGPR